MLSPIMLGLDILDQVENCHFLSSLSKEHKKKPQKHADDMVLLSNVEVISIKTVLLVNYCQKE